MIDRTHALCPGCHRLRPVELDRGGVEVIAGHDTSATSGVRCRGSRASAVGAMSTWREVGVPRVAVWGEA